MSIEINGVMVKLSRHSFGNRRSNVEKTQEVHEQDGTAEWTGEWKDVVFPKGFIAPLNRFMNKLYDWHTSEALPWEHGYRILSAGNVEPYRQEITVWEGLLEKVLSEAALRFDQAMNEVRLAKNGKFDQAAYPSCAQFIREWSFEVDYQPVSESRHYQFVKGLCEKESQRMQAEFDERLQARTKEAIGTALRRVLDPLHYLAERLADPKAIFRDHLIENVKRAADHTATLTFLNDPTLFDLRDRIHRVLDGIDGEAMRADPMLRIQTASRAIDVVASFGNQKRKLAA